MLEAKDRYIPISYAQNYRTSSEVVLPQYVQPDEILLNLTGINRLCNLGGIRNLKLYNQKNDETSSAVPTIVGFTHNGEALAGKTKVNLIPEYTADSSGDSTKYIKCHAERWINTSIAVNTEEINQRIQNENKWPNGVRSSEAWATHLNKAIKNGVTKEGVRHLAVGLDTSNWIKSGIQYGMMSMFELSNHPTIEGMAARVVIGSSMLNLIYLATAENKSDFRFSLLYGPQLDRALVLYLTSLRTTLVKNIPKDQLLSSDLLD